ncbi:MAG: DUF167 domain-containing protein [Aquificae bacterium]|nr:DUF167 domain-containing protein [Aquificota bacterium]
MIVDVKVKPNSKKEQILKIDENSFEIRVKEPPEKGRANQKVIELLAKFYKIPKSKIKIKKGKTSSRKIIEIEI